MATNYTIGQQHFAVKFSGRRGEKIFDIEETEAEFEGRTKLEMIRGDDGMSFMGRKEFMAYIMEFSCTRRRATHVLFLTDEHGNC